MGEVWLGIVVVKPATGVRSDELTALADTGATLTMVPASVLRDIGVAPGGQITVRLADGRCAVRQVGDAIVAPERGCDSLPGDLR